MEPWDTIAKCDANFGHKVCSGIDPGMHISIKSSNEAVYTTLAFSAVNSLFTAYSGGLPVWWGGLRGA